MITELLKEIYEGNEEEKMIKEIGKEDLENFILEIFNKGILNSYLGV